MYKASVKEDMLRWQTTLKHHGSQDWPWLYEDFRRKGVQAQPWEATLAADFEQAVTGPLRRALRASGNLANFVRQLRPVAEIQFDPAEAVLPDPTTP